MNHSRKRGESSERTRKTSEEDDDVVDEKQQKNQRNVGATRTSIVALIAPPPGTGAGAGGSSSLTRRGRRDRTTKVYGEMQEITEGMSFYELQAQEQIIARFRAQKRRKVSGNENYFESTRPLVACGYDGHEEQVCDKSSQLMDNRMNASDVRGKERARKHFYTYKVRKSAPSVCVVTKPYDQESESEENEVRDEEKEWNTFTKKSAQREYLRKQKHNGTVVDARMMEHSCENDEEIPVSWERSDYHKPGAKPLMACTKRFLQHKTAERKTRQRVKPIKARKNSLSEVESEQESEEQKSNDESEDDEVEIVTVPMSRRQEKVNLRNNATSKRSLVDPPKRRRDENLLFALHCRSNAAQASSRTFVCGARDTQRLAEKMSLRELQEQEKLLLFFHAQKKRNSLSTVRKGGNSAHSTTTSKTNGSGCRARMGFNPKEFIGTLSSSTCIAPPCRNGFLASSAELVSVAECTATPIKKASNPVMHSTAWRRLAFKEAPPNILGGVSAVPYSFGSDRPLWAFDTTGELKKKCELRAVDASVVATVDNSENQPPSQSEVNNQVRALAKQELPEIKTCHARRVRHTLKEMRNQLSEYFKAYQVLRSERYRRLQWSETANHHSWSSASPTERVAAKRVLQNSMHTFQPYNCLVGVVRYYVHQGQMHLGSLLYPETITLLSYDISATSRSFTMIGIRKNAFVEDDPILRYVPYLGDGERMVIDNDLYSGTTMSKERRIAVFGEGEELTVLNPGAPDDEIMEYLLRVIVGKCGASEQVFLALQHEWGFNRPRMDYCSMYDLAETERRITSRVAKVKELVALQQQSSPDKTAEASVAQVNASKSLCKLAQPHWFLHDKSEPQSLSLRLQPPLSVFESSYADSPETLGIRDRPTYEGLTEWHRDLFCRRCYFYDCFEHGIQNPQRSVRTDPIYPMVTVPGIVLARQEIPIQEIDLSAEDASPYSSTLPVEVAVLIGSSSSDDEVEESKDQHSSLSQSTTLYRRSRRAQTRISSLASKSLRTQEKMLETERLAELEKRKRRREKFARAADKSEYLDNSYLPAVTASLKKLLSKTKPCGPSCWLSSGNMNPSDVCAPLKQVDSVLVRKLVSTLGPNACMIAAMLKSPRCTCAQVSRFLADEKRRKDSGDKLGGENELLISSEKQRKGRRGVGVSLNRSLAKRIREQRSYDREKRLSYEPCNHNGVCNETCECTKRGHSCNKACSCPRDCPNRFQGCKCSTGNCHTSACPCWSAGRECDPDYCFNCGASDAAVMMFHPEFKHQSSSHLRICHNVNMLRSTIQKKIGVAFSAIHGWGAYALEPIRKDDFVLEYTGELITDDEAERRGAIYDRKSVSYLFGVNSDYVVDAARKGNKAKFANHKPKEDANLDVRVITSNGEHRIGLFAREAIEVGAELFFDYGYTHDSAPRWSQHETTFEREERAYDLVDDEKEWE
ncbi:unnamed protein product [Peronospora belbahrii]|uniref:[Histone H3]-lysine(27) N-trimethyltransferase n=1 Tax=Peronospora belbahrii TaxID=622444 RepID=A0AAU9KM99_9STRA|nr:unnamed protein product [Peronospora belbahrii]